MVLPAPLSVREAAWTEHLESLPWLTLLGMLVAYLLVRARASWPLAHLLGLGLGAEVIAYTFSRIPTDGTLFERVQWLSDRVATWLQVVLGGGASSDLVMFAVGMAALGWLLGYTSAWLVFRDRSPWLALALNGMALLVNLSYAPPTLAGYVGWLLFGGFVLVAASHMADRVEVWRAARIVVEPRVAGVAVAGGVIAGTLVLAVAWTLPAADANPSVAEQWDQLTAPWQGVERDLDRFFASISGSARSSSRGLNFGRTLAPRGSFDLPDTPVLQVRSPQRLYWRATTAERYTGSAIMGGETTHSHAEAQAALPREGPETAARTEVQAAIKVLATRSVVVFAPEAPVRLSVAADVETRSGTGDVVTVRPEAPLQHDQVYTVTSAVSNASLRELREAGRDYPAWVRRTYLQLPRSLPRRVANLAARIAADQPSPLDEALSIESYLRTELTYSTHVSEVPPNRDWVDFFLFDSKEGYCDYFATAMTVMLRTQGIPARVASGFAPGEFDPSTGTWIVRENQAHSWVEVYFPGYGWITFEPSAVRTLPDRYAAEPSTVPGAESTTGDPGVSSQRLTPDEQDELRGLDAGGSAAPWNRFPSTPLEAALATLGALAGLAVVGSALVALLWRRGVAGLPWYQQPYAQMVRLGRWVGGSRPAPGDTAYEIADDLAHDVPEAAPTIRRLARAYVEGTYAGRAPRTDPAVVWRAERLGLTRALVMRRLRQVAARLRARLDRE